MAAEISPSRPAPPPLAARFNEAAANGRGNRTEPVAGRVVCELASMRPRRMAAEIAGAVGGGDSVMRGASMRPRRMAAEIVRTARDAECGACGLQ